MIEARADGEDPIYYLLRFTDIVEGFFSPNVDFFREDPTFWVL